MKANDKPAEPKEKFTANLNISNVPVKTIEQLNSIADKKGITTTAYVKGIIHDALKEVK